jgi:hypothetical protein
MGAAAQASDPVWRFRGKAPLAVAGLIAFPTFLASLMLSTLAIERPQVFVWVHHGHKVVRYHEPSNSNELKIWVLAAIPPLLLLAAGAIAMWLPRGVYIAALCGIIGALVLPLRLDTWTLHHSIRFPEGIDLIPKSSTSNLVDRGEWEATARSTVLSLQKLTIGLCVAIIVIAVLVEVRRRRGVPAAPLAPPPVSGDTGAVPSAGAGLDPFA